MTTETGTKVDALVSVTAEKLDLQQVFTESTYRTGGDTAGKTPVVILAGKTQVGKTQVGKTQAGKTQAGKTQVGKTQVGKTRACKTWAREKRVGHARPPERPNRVVRAVGARSPAPAARRALWWCSSPFFWGRFGPVSGAIERDRLAIIVACTHGKVRATVGLSMMVDVG